MLMRESSREALPDAVPVLWRASVTLQRRACERRTPRRAPWRTHVTGVKTHAVSSSDFIIGITAIIVAIIIILVIIISSIFIIVVLLLLLIVQKIVEGHQLRRLQCDV
jgi:hypothetical protein